MVREVTRTAYITAYCAHHVRGDELNGACTPLSEVWIAGEPVTGRTIDFYDQHWAFLSQQVHVQTKGRPTDLLPADLLDSKGNIVVPKTFDEAMKLPNAKAWKVAFDTEVNNILDRGVLGPFITDEQLAKEKLITHKRIPMKMLFDVKLNPDNSFDKLKCRLVVLGHPGYLRRGEHFWNTYSASPAMSTPRMMQAICVQMGYKRRCYDLVAAYLWATCRAEERLAIDLPPGMGKKDKSGRQMCRILEKTCYGCPYSDRRFCELRDEYILDTFSKDGYTVFQSQYNPCLFIIRRPADGAHCILSTFTDDIDSIGSHDDALDYIADKFDERFAIKMVNADFMVGVQRVTAEDGKTVTLSQPGFIDNLVDSFRDKLTGRNVNTPFPPGLHLQRSGNPMAKEDGKAIYDRGLYSVIGSLLWTMRNCHPETAIGVNYLCSVMSEPTEEAWAAAMHMIKWLRDNKDLGLRFTRQEKTPTMECYYDASANPDRIDHRMRGGFVITMNGTAIDWGACKLPRGHQHFACRVPGSLLGHTGDNLSSSHLGGHGIWTLGRGSDFDVRRQRRVHVARP